MMGKQAEKRSNVLNEVKAKYFQKKRLSKWLVIIMLVCTLFIEQTSPTLAVVSRVQASEAQGNVLIRRGGVAASINGQSERRSGTDNNQNGSGENSSDIGSNQSGSGVEDNQSTDGESGSGTGGNQSGSSENESDESGSSESESNKNGSNEGGSNEGGSNENASDDNENSTDNNENVDNNENNNENDNNENSSEESAKDDNETTTETTQETDTISGGDPPSDITARQALENILAEKTILALVYLSAEYPIRQAPLYGAKSLVTVPSGQQVQIQGEEPDEAGELWVWVCLTYRGESYEGYIPRTYLACSDELFLEWEKKYGMLVATQKKSSRSTTGYPEIDQFPDSYRDALLTLKKAHPNWIFVMQNTNLDWNTVVTNEMIQPRSLVPDSYPIYQKQGAYGTTGWSYATEDTLKYYLDPRNWIQDATIFQFELLTYNATYHTESAVQRFLNGTFMASSIPGTGQTYANAFWTIGSDLSVSPFHLACRVYQEQGQGQSALISGTYPKYEGLYNYFNIGATGSTKEEEIITGLKKAREQEWTTRYASLSGGADFISHSYILIGQDTLYLQKFDVDNSDGKLYWHQYMQNIVAPTSEGKNIRKSYNNAGSLDNTFVFKIPVYQNMPYTACLNPTQYGITVTPPETYLSGYTADPVLTQIWVDGMPYPSNIGANQQASAYYASDKAKTAVMYQYNTSGIPVGMYVWTLSYDTKNQKYVTTPIPTLQDLLTYHGFSIRVTGKTGIRIKTGISSDLRGQLATSGAAGYTLKEYGSLVMLSANQGTYPFIKGGNKVNSSLAYGMTDDGMKDYIHETVGGRYRFTSVLVNLPVTQYKTDFAFRGYIILSKGGQDITLYGPPRSSNIYYLAKRALDSGVYASGSAPDLFLRQLISDADNQSG